MNIGKYHVFCTKEIKEIKYHSIEFNPAMINNCAKELQKLLRDKWHINERWQTENGIVIELVRF